MIGLLVLLVLEYELNPVEIGLGALASLVCSVQFASLSDMVRIAPLLTLTLMVGELLVYKTRATERPTESITN